MADAVLVTSSFLPGTGGIETYLAELCADLAPRLAVLAPPRRDGAGVPPDLPYPTSAGPSTMRVVPIGVIDDILRECARHGTSKVVFGTPWPLALIGPSLAARGIGYAVIIHGAELMLPAVVPGIGRRLAKALSAAELLLPVSNYTADRTRSLMERKRMSAPLMASLRARVDTTRFSPDVEVSELRASLGIEAGAPVVAFVSRLVARKGAARLVRAMPEIARRVPGATAVIAGTGPELKRVRKLARDAPVLVVGRMPDAQIPALYALADVFAFPVTDRWFGLEMEGLGVVLLEASACGTPCVTGRSGGTPEAVRDGQTGFVIDGADSDALVERVVELLDDRAKAAAMGAAARAHVEANFSHAKPPEALLEWMDRGRSITRHATNA